MHTCNVTPKPFYYTFSVIMCMENEEIDFFLISQR
jgi:hypothetical protein